MNQSYGSIGSIARVGLFVIGALFAAAGSTVADGGGGADAVYSDNVVIVLDCSGSMKTNMRGTGTQKLEAAKQALRTVLQGVPETTKIGLLVFSAGGVRNEWVYPLGPKDNQRLLNAIALPRPQGSTPLGRYIKAGADRLLQEREKQSGYGSYRLLVVTDGEADDPQLVDRYVPEVMARGIRMDVIGVDMKQDHTLATKVHSYRRANDPESLERSIAEVLAEVGGSRDDLAGESAFAEIAPIPAEVAAAALEALFKSGNEPIGSGPAPARRSPASAGAARSAKAAPAAGPTPGSARNRPVFFSPTVILVIVALIVVSGFFRRARRSR